MDELTKEQYLVKVLEKYYSRLDDAIVGATLALGGTSNPSAIIRLIWLIADYDLIRQDIRAIINTEGRSV